MTDWTVLSVHEETKDAVRALKHDEEESDEAVVSRLLAAHEDDLRSYRDAATDPDTESESADAPPGGSCACECQCQFSADDVSAVVERKVADALSELRR